MPGASSRDVLRQLNILFHCGTTGQLSDAELLERFAAGGGETAEAAFAALVERHGKMVLGVCQRVLGNREAAEDAFQATFLVLARKAASIARREQLANWLYGVARRAALDARSRAARQRAREKRYGAMRPVEMPDPFTSNELRAVLDEELARLPERYRAAIVLCELEGLSRRQAAAQLGISEGTISSRLARAKVQLKDRLIRRGLALSAAALGSFLAQDSLAVVVPPTLADSTIQLATLVSSGTSLAGIVSTPVATLTEGVLKAMLFAKMKSVFLGIATLALVTTGMGVLAQTGPGTGPAPDDRLKAVEQKLDRLLEVLGGSNRRAPTQELLPASSAPVPDVVPMANTPAVPSNPPLDALPPPATDSRATTLRHLLRGSCNPELLPTRSSRPLRREVKFEAVPPVQDRSRASRNPWLDVSRLSSSGLTVSSAGSVHWSVGFSKFPAVHQYPNFPFPEPVLLLMSPPLSPETLALLHHRRTPCIPSAPPARILFRPPGRKPQPPSPPSDLPASDGPR